MIFSVLKQWWIEARDEYKRTHGERVDKTNFLSIYVKAHAAALTKKNIQATFRKMGVIPLNRNVVTTEMLAPSTTSSSQGILPLPQASPVCIMRDMIYC